jgi:hypothetical protein
VYVWYSNQFVTNTIPTTYLWICENITQLLGIILLLTFPLSWQEQVGQYVWPIPFYLFYSQQIRSQCKISICFIAQARTAAHYKCSTSKQMQVYMHNIKINVTRYPCKHMHILWLTASFSSFKIYCILKFIHYSNTYIKVNFCMF